MKTPPTNRPRLGFWLLLLSASGALANAARAEEPLRWRWKAGDSLRYEFTQKNRVTIKADAQESVSTTDLTIAMTWTVKSVSAEGAADVRLVVDRVRAEIQAGGPKIRYDSKADPSAADPAAQPLRDVYSAAVGPEYGLTVDGRGRVLAARVPEPVTRAVRGSAFVSVADGGSVLSEAGLKNMLAQVVPPLPEKAVSPGAAWDAALSLPTAPLAMTLRFRYTLDSLTDASAAIKAAITSGLTPEPGTPFTVAVKAEAGSASFAFDRKAGRLSGSEVTQSIDLSLGFMKRDIGQSIAVSERLTLVP